MWKKNNNNKILGFTGKVICNFNVTKYTMSSKTKEPFINNLQEIFDLSKCLCYPKFISDLLGKICVNSVFIKVSGISGDLIKWVCLQQHPSQ